MKRFVNLFWYFLAGYNVGFAIIFAKHGDWLALGFVLGAAISLYFATKGDPE